MKVSKYIAADTNILIEYIYDDTNLISEPYNILINTKTNDKSFLSTDTSASLNVASNQLVQLDSVMNIYGKLDTTNYSFLQLNNYASGFPIAYDTINVHLPINYTFGQYIGMYLRVYAFDTKNVKKYDLCNFYWDITDVNTKNLIEYVNPPLFFKEKLWGKELQITVPSLYVISNQMTAGYTTENSINSILTSGAGLNQQSPIFIEFSFVNTKKTINNITTYYLASPIKISIPQIPDYQTLGCTIQHSNNGDYFEIFGTFNGTIAGFNDFIKNAVYLGNRYYVQYIVTTYEQNIRGKTSVITVTDNFNEPYEFRPIIKSSSTTAVIDVQMMLIDSVDNTQILRQASYGLLNDEVCKYSSNLTKINISNAIKPVIYNLKTQNMFNTNYVSNSAYNNPNVSSNNTTIQTVNVPYAVLVESYNVIIKSDNAIANHSTFFGDGKLLIMIKPFDNVLKFTIAIDTTPQNNIPTPIYMDLTKMGEINLVFKNTQLTSTFPLFPNNNSIDLKNGTVVFSISANKISDIRNIFNSGTNVFYITATSQNITSSIYSGLYNMYDSATNISHLNTIATQQSLNNTNAAANITPLTNGISTSKIVLQNVGGNNINNQVAIPNNTNIINKNI